MCVGHSVSGKFGPGPSFGNLELVRQSGVTQDYVYAGTGIESTVPPGALTPAGRDAPTSVVSTPGSQNLVAYDDFGRVASHGGAMYHHDLFGRMDWFVAADGTREDLRYDPFGVLLSRQIGTKVVSYVGDSATVTGTLAAGCQTPSCGINPATVQVDVHVAVGGLRVASVRSGAGTGRTVYLHRDRLGSVVATTLAGGLRGASYRWDAYGALEGATSDTGDAKSELGYTGALRLSGGLAVMGVRIYHAGLRTFLEPDPLEPFKYDYAGGDSDQPGRSDGDGGRSCDGRVPRVGHLASERTA
jgi:hypothetical protein